VTLRVGVIGLGVGAQHALAYRSHPECEVVALCDRSRARREEVGAAHPGVRLHEDPRAVLEDAAVDLVSIASHDQDHFAQVVAALDAGKHVFVEKPLCRTADELRVVKARWSAGRVALASNLVLRAAPLYRWLRDAIAGGRLGDLYALDGDYLYGRLHKITEGWRKDVDDYSVMQGGGIHLVDLMLWLTGERPRAVTAAGSRRATAGTGFRYDDFRAATFLFESGLVGRITANFACVHPHQHVLRVFGTQATVLYDDQGARLIEGREVGDTRGLSAAPLPAGKGELIPAFVDGILEGRDRRAETQHELDVISACLAADAAAARGVSMEIEYV
jgi:predicted dehydrogenase